jgi:hypothetical protein
MLFAIYLNPKEIRQLKIKEIQILKQNYNKNKAHSLIERNVDKENLKRDIKTLKISSFDN